MPTKPNCAVVNSFIEEAINKEESSPSRSLSGRTSWNRFRFRARAPAWKD
jgi:hypothetical protein